MGYKGKKSGYLSRVTNAHDDKQYIVSTARVRGGDWQTSVLRPGFFGAVLGAFRPLLTYDGLTDENASLVHDQIEAEQLASVSQITAGSPTVANRPIHRGMAWPRIKK